jgi:hypothetical protein
MAVVYWASMVPPALKNFTEGREGREGREGKNRWAQWAPAAAVVEPLRSSRPSVNGFRF